MTNEKKIIEDLISENRIESAFDAISDYQKIHPFDADIISFYTAAYLQSGDIAAALDHAREGVKRLPLNGEMQYNLAVVCEASDLLFDAYQAYIRADHIFKYTKDDRLSALNPMQKANDIMQNIISKADSGQLSAEEMTAIIKQLEILSNMSGNSFGMCEQAFRRYEMELIGSWYYDTPHSKRYVGVFRDQYFNTENTCECRDLVHIKGEFLEAEEGSDYHLDNSSSEYLFPIASTEPNIHVFKTQERDYTIVQNNPFRFTYYRTPGNTDVISRNKCIYGNPIPLKCDKNKKKLVMSIFVDGLSYDILKGDGFVKNMPLTYEFFSKGTIFTHAFNTAEWTYPSIASIVTGLDTTHHMLFHHTLDYPMPEDIPTLAEFFHNDGYFTSKYCGNWRIIPSYGHARGYDRFIYQHAYSGFKVYDVVSDAINQLEIGNDINQYIWISIGDLHDIADKVELPVCVQKNIPISNREYKGNGSTSVKQEYDPNAIAAYIKTANFIDKWLHILFTYIEEHYSDEDIVISLFSDHGQGFLISGENSHFLSSPRSNIPMMFRGGITSGTGYSDETISALDYGYALRRAANINCNEISTDGRLPHTFGGLSSREFAYTESIHPGDPYQAAIFAPEKDLAFFFTNSEPVMDDGRFVLSDYNAFLTTYDGNRINDNNKYKYYLNIVLEHIAPLLIYD